MRAEFKLSPADAGGYILEVSFHSSEGLLDGSYIFIRSPVKIHTALDWYLSMRTQKDTLEYIASLDEGPKP